MDVRRIILAQTNRYSAAVRKLLSIKGEQHEVGFGVHLEDERPEHSFVKGERLFVQYNEVVSAAGTLSLIGVTNPLASGILVVLTSLHATVTTAPAFLSFGFANNGNAKQGPMWFRDTRWNAASGLGTTAQMIATTAAAPGFTGLWDTIQCAAAEQLVDFIAPGARIPNVVLGPGSAAYCAVVGVGVNTLKAMVTGYERSLESGELIP